MLEYFKLILQKVSFDRRLFEKELRKAIRSLIADEVEELESWCYDQYGNVYPQVLSRCFVNV